MKKEELLFEEEEKEVEEEVEIIGVGTTYDIDCPRCSNTGKLEITTTGFDIEDFAYVDFFGMPIGLYCEKCETKYSILEDGENFGELDFDLPAIMDKHFGQFEEEQCEL